jgi:hypothetical protein
MNLEEFRRRRRELARVELWEEAGAYQTKREVREDMRRGLIDEIAAASIDQVLAGIDVMLTFERLNWDDAS